MTVVTASLWQRLLQLSLLLLLLLFGCSQGGVRLTEHQSHRDFVPLSSSNLSLALQDDQAWVLHLHNGSIFSEFKRLAASVRGLVRFGLLSREDRPAAAAFKLDPKNLPEFRALSFGLQSKKEKSFLNTDVFAEALDFASKSVPADQLTIVSSQKQLKQLLKEAVTSSPSRFTVLFTIRDETPTLLQRVLSQKLVATFNFGVVPRAEDPDAMAAAGLRGVKWPVPGLAVLAVRPDGSVQSSRVDETKRAWDGDFAATLQFLVEFNRQFRPQLPGDNRSSDRRVMYMTDVLDKERLVFDVRDEQRVDGAAAGGGEDLKDEL